MRQGTGAVALVFFGDGAMEEGVFSETLSTFGGTWTKRSAGPYFFTPFVIAQTTYLRSAAALSLFVGRMMYVKV